MKTKITMKDIAREAGVSVATVSYILNNRTEQRISEETRKKVLQIVNLLNYTPNQSAKALATNRSRNIAVYLPAGTSPFKCAEQLYFLNDFAALLHQHGYSLIHLCPNVFKQIDNVDAIICYDVKAMDFHNLGDHNFVPLLSIDGFINDPLFFQVISDYARIREDASRHFDGKDFVFAALETINDKRRELLVELFPSVVTINSPADILTLQEENVVTTEHTIANLLSASGRLFYYPSLTQAKFDKVLECMECAINRVPVKEHSILV